MGPPFYNRHMSTRVRSHAKINLGLGIGAPRQDGFHGLSTVYQTLEIHDVVTVSARPAALTTLRLTCNDARVPTDSRNTAWKMVSLALDALGTTAAVDIHIEKRLPIQGGLGAGSANAVAALIGLEWELAAAPALDSETRLRLAAQVGSDVPLFLIGGAVLGVDRGQEVYPLPDLEPVDCVLAVPETGVSTPQAFRDWDALCAAQGLTPAASADKLKRLSRAFLSAFGRDSPGEGEEAGSSGVLPKLPFTGRTWPDRQGPRLSAPGSRAGFRTTSSRSSSPSILPLPKSSASLRPRPPRRQPSLLRCRAPARRSSGCTKPAETLRKPRNASARPRTWKRASRAPSPGPNTGAE